MHFAAFDSIGNVTALVSATNGAVTAQYEYGPFGEFIRATGPMAKLNPFRFSTKFYDEETGLYYYGYRYYNPSTGRWPSRDPIQEQGGLNLYGFVGNSPIIHIDRMGMESIGPNILSICASCAQSLIFNAIQDDLNQHFACGALYNNLIGTGSDSNPADADLCKGYKFDTTLDPDPPKNIASQLSSCILSGLKGEAIDQALKGVTDPKEKKILAQLIEKATDVNVKATLKINGVAKCVMKKVSITLTYTETLSIDGISMDAKTSTVGPYPCGGQNILFGTPNMDGRCSCCQN